MSGVNPFISNFLVLPLAIIILVGTIYLTKKFRYNPSNSVTKLFGIGFLLFLILSALKYFFGGNTAIDLQLYDTYFVIADYYILFSFSIILGFYAVVYSVTPKIIKRELNQTLGQLHFWLTTIGVLFLIYPIYYLGMAGVPRRYYSVENIDGYKQFENLKMVITIIAILVFLSQFIFLINLVYSLLKHPKSLE